MSRKTSTVDNPVVMTLPDIKWSDDALHIDDIATSLPRVLKWDKTKHATSTTITVAETYLESPILAYGALNTKKALANILSVKKDKKGEIQSICEETTKQDGTETKLVCSIPGRNEIWFSILGSKVKKYTHIEEFLKSEVTSFMNTKPLNARIVKMENYEIQEKVVIAPYSVIQLYRHTRLNDGRALSVIQDVCLGTSIKKLKQYAQCNMKDTDLVFIKLKEKGEFYPVEINGECDSGKCLMQIHHITSNCQLPVDIEYRFGNKPNLRCFTNYFRLERIINERVLICVTLIDPKNVLFDLPQDEKHKKYYLAENEDIIKACGAYKRALDYCMSEVPKYLADIKMHNEVFNKSEAVALIEQNIEHIRKASLLSPFSEPTAAFDLRVPPTPCKMHEKDGDQIVHLDYRMRVKDPETNNNSNFGRICDSGFPISIRSSTESSTSCKTLHDSIVKEEESRDDCAKNIDDGYKTIAQLIAQHESYKKKQFMSRRSQQSEDSDDGDETELSESQRVQSANDQNQIKRLSVRALADYLTNCAISQDIINQVELNRIDGELLSTMTLEDLKNTFATATGIDLIKINRIITTGWQPRT